MFWNIGNKLSFFAMRGQIGMRVWRAAIMLVSPPWRVSTMKYRGGQLRITNIGPLQINAGAA